LNDLLVPAANPKSNYLAHKDEIDQAVLRVMEAGVYILGDEVAAFEQAFAKYIGARTAVAVGNGTDALHLALRACGIGPGDVVITVSHTAVATVAAIELAGARPLLVDIDPVSFTIDPQRVAEAIIDFKSRASNGRELKAIIPVHLYGQPCDMQSLTHIARAHGLRIIEDCSQSHGAMIDGQKTGTFADVGTFSFYPTKNLGALGDGGAITSNDPELAQKARELREYGWQRRYISDIAGGMNTRLDPLQAAILNVKLQYLDAENCRRRQIAAAYDKAWSPGDLVLPQSREGQTPVYHQYVIRSQKRDRFREFLLSKSVGTAIHYPMAVHQQPAYYSRVMVGPGGLAESERAVREIVSLPIYPQMTDEQTQLVVETIREWRY